MDQSLGSLAELSGLTQQDHDPNTIFHKPKPSTPQILTPGADSLWVGALMPSQGFGAWVN